MIVFPFTGIHTSPVCSSGSMSNGLIIFFFFVLFSTWIREGKGKSRYYPFSHSLPLDCVMSVYIYTSSVYILKRTQHEIFNRISTFTARRSESVAAAAVFISNQLERFLFLSNPKWPVFVCTVRILFLWNFTTKAQKTTCIILFLWGYALVIWRSPSAVVTYQMVNFFSNSAELSHTPTIIKKYLHRNLKGEKYIRHYPHTQHTHAYLL